MNNKPKKKTLWTVWAFITDSDGRIKQCRDIYCESRAEAEAAYKFFQCTGKIKHGVYNAENAEKYLGWERSWRSFYYGETYWLHIFK